MFARCFGNSGENALQRRDRLHGVKCLACLYFYFFCFRWLPLSFDHTYLRFDIIIPSVVLVSEYYVL
jgi:hypothetical protein